MWCLPDTAATALHVCNIYNFMSRYENLGRARSSSSLSCRMDSIMLINPVLTLLGPLLGCVEERTHMVTFLCPVEEKSFCTHVQ